MQTATLNVDQLVGVEHFRPIEEKLSSELTQLRECADRVNIYRPLGAYRMLRKLSSELMALKPQLDIWVATCSKAIGAIDVTTMGQVVTAPVLMLSIQMRLMQKEQEYNDICNQLNTLKAFAFGLFAMYVSIVSLLATLVIGFFPLLLTK